MSEFGAADFAGLGANDQSQIMRDWFLANYEDPVHSLPYESREGGYIWVYGGPYDAHEVLHDKFGEFVSEAVIDQLGHELFAESPEWAAQDADYDFAYISESTAYFDEYQLAMDNNHALFAVNMPESVQNIFYGMVFVNLVTIMEAYLSDAFIGLVLESEALMRKFVETTPEFKDRKISLSNIYGSLDEISKTAEMYLGSVVWHRLDVVRNMYSDTLGVSFPDDLRALFLAIQVRHALAHRNGKIKGKAVSITEEIIQELTGEIDTLISHIEQQIQDLGAAAYPC